MSASYNLQIGLDPSVLAVCARFLKQGGYSCYTASAVGRAIMEAAAKDIVASETVPPFPNEEAAIVWLRKNGFPLKQLDNPERNKKLISVLSKASILAPQLRVAVPEDDAKLKELQDMVSESGRAPSHNKSKKEGETA